MDWISAKLEWTPEKASAALEQKLREDIEVWQGKVHANIAGLVTVATLYAQFSITRQAMYGPSEKWAGLAVSSEDNGIRLRRHSHTEPEVITVVLNEKGEQRLKFGERELELWQASREILEPLLF